MCAGEGDEQEKCIQQQTVEIPKVKSFKYQAFIVQEDGGSNIEVGRRIVSGWYGSKNVNGVLCDKSAPIWIEGRLYTTMMRQ